MVRGAELLGLRAFARVAGLLPWGAGQFRLAERYAALGRWPKGTLLHQRMRYGGRAVLDIGDRSQLIAFAVRDYSPSLAEYIVGRLPPGGAFVDVGAHIGLISFGVWARRPDVSVHAFEPHPANADAWRRNRQLSGSTSAHLVEAGLSDHSGEMRFDGTGDSGGHAITTGGVSSIRVATLDDYCLEHGVERIDVLKIDVQGHEMEVLRGADRLFADGRIGTVLCEIDVAPEEEIIELLAGHGLRRAAVPHVGLRARLGRWIPSRAESDLAFERH